MKKIFFLFLVFAFFLCGCTHKENVSMSSATLLIMGGHGRNPCVFKILSDGTLEVTTGPLHTVRFGEAHYTDDDYFTEDAQRKSTRISRKNKERIESLISQVKETGDPEYDQPQGVDDGVIVYATIDNVGYMALYKNDIIFYGEKNTELSDLAEILFDISPIKVKGFEGKQT